VGVFLAVALLSLAATGRPAIVLHPGTVTGNTGLTHWAFTSGSVTVSGNPNDFYGSQSFSGTPAYSVTVEGAQTYGAVSQSLNGPSVSFSETVNSSFTVPIGGAITQNLLAAGGTVQVDVSAVGATVMSLYASAYASSGSTSYSGSGSVGGASALVPMGATTETVTAECTSYLQVVDTQPPVIGSVTVSPSVLEHGGPMVPVSVSASDACSGSRLSCRIVSAQNPEPGPQHDSDITGPLTVNLHPSHKGAFTIAVRCADPRGNSSEKAVTVPIEKKNGK
jgi:hypothetical protein